MIVGPRGTGRRDPWITSGIHRRHGGRTWKRGTAIRLRGRSSLHLLGNEETSEGLCELSITTDTIP